MDAWYILLNFWEIYTLYSSFSNNPRLTSAPFSAPNHSQSPASLSYRRQRHLVTNSSKISKSRTTMCHRQKRNSDIFAKVAILLVLLPQMAQTKKYARGKIIFVYFIGVFAEHGSAMEGHYPHELILDTKYANWKVQGGKANLAGWVFLCISTAWSQILIWKLAKKILRSYPMIPLTHKIFTQLQS